MHNVVRFWKSLVFPSHFLLNAIYFYANAVRGELALEQPAAEKSGTSKLWIYDLRTNKDFTLKENLLKRIDLDDFVSCYNPKIRHERKESERFKSFTYEELAKRDKLNLDIFWLKDESLEDSANLPDPDIIAAEIVEDLQAALAQFAEIANDLEKSK
jgi:type I restriction enzyme M protein